MAIVFQHRRAELVIVRVTPLEEHEEPGPPNELVGLLFLLIQAFGGDLGRSIPYVTALELMALCVLIALGAAILTAWRASGEKPLNVLRYE